MRVALLAFALSLVACTRSESSSTPGADAAGADGDLADAGGSDAIATDGATDSLTPGGDAGPPPAYVEPSGSSSDPFLGGTAASTGIALGPSDSVTIAGSIASGGTNPAWADSDGYAFTVSAATTVQAELLFPKTGTVWSLAIHRADRTLVAWWGMATEGRALTQPKTLAPGAYFVHVAAAAPAPAAPVPYTVRLRSGDLGDCAAGAVTTYVETEATVRANDTVSVDWFAYPRLAATAATDAPEVTGITLSAGATAVVEGTSGATTPASDTYLDRDAYAFTAGPDTHEVRVLLEYAAADVNLDVFVLEAEAGKLVGTGVEVGDSPERAAIPVEPGKTYWLWIGARDERSIGGDKTLPARYRATLCGRGGAK